MLLAREPIAVDVTRLGAHDPGGVKGAMPDDLAAHVRRRDDVAKVVRVQHRRLITLVSEHARCRRAEDMLGSDFAAAAILDGHPCVYRCDRVVAVLVLVNHCHHRGVDGLCQTLTANAQVVRGDTIANLEVTEAIEVELVLPDNRHA